MIGIRRAKVRAGMVAALGLVVASCSSAPTRAVGLRWQAVDQLGPPPFQVGALLAAGSGEPWLLGGNSRAGGTPVVRIWHSFDRSAWSTAVTTGLTLDAPQNLVFGIARHDGVLVALGETPGQAHGNPRPTIWRSTDGLTWSEVPTLREDFGGPHLTDLRAVSAGPGGFAVVGNWKGDGDRPIVAVWLSADGTHWTREDHVPELTSVGDEELTAMDIAGGPSGFVIVGESYAPTPARADRVVGFIATSTDGRSWRRLPGDQSGLDAGAQVAVRRVVVQGDGFVAIGTRSTGPRNEVAAWRGSPVERWSVTPIATTPYIQGTAVAADGATCWAAVAANGGLRIWQSTGRAWRPASPPFATDAQSVLIGAAAGSLLVAAQTGPRGTLWTASESAGQ